MMTRLAKTTTPKGVSAITQAYGLPPRHNRALPLVQGTEKAAEMFEHRMHFYSDEATLGLYVLEFQTG